MHQFGFKITYTIPVDQYLFGKGGDANLGKADREDRYNLKIFKHKC